MPKHRPVAYPAIEQLGLIGDRRTAALVAADGTMNFLCLPDYDGDLIFGALLDHQEGGFWTMGPARRLIGTQKYLDDSAILVTSWECGQGRLELTDLMAWPEQDRPAEKKGQHVVLRRLRCTAGRMPCCVRVYPRDNFRPADSRAETAGTASFKAGEHELVLWMNRGVSLNENKAETDFELGAGEEAWAVLATAGTKESWSVSRAREMLAETQSYWTHWFAKLNYDGPRWRTVQRSAMCIHLLTYAPVGSVVAASTTSLPERIGGDWNADYRLAWVRDASLSLMMLTQLGVDGDTRRYLDWLTTLKKPLQTIYGIRGERKLKQLNDKKHFGYRGSKPIRFGNHAYKQKQHDAAGYLIDCIKIYADEGDEWDPRYWDLVRGEADHIVKIWDKTGNSIWELSDQRYFVADKVMCWVGLDRALKLAEKLDETGDVDKWRATREAIHAEVLERGWSEKLKSFRQHYDADNVDSAVLLIPIMGFLPPDDPRVVSTVQCIEERLMIDNFVYRFDPEESPGVPQPPLPLGEFEGAFLPCTFWMANTYALMGKVDRAESILAQVERVAGANGLFAEAVDARSGTFRGNYPLLFSHTEYVRAVRAIDRARAGQVNAQAPVPEARRELDAAQA